ncbi:MAG: efflux RND transporter periplasmic adaptor subunit [Bacteroidales bacterium]
MKRLIVILLAAIVVAALVLLRIYVFAPKTEKPAQPGAVRELPVECYLLRDTVAGYSLETVGTLLAREQVDIVSELQRKVVAIHLSEGDLVRSGQLLFKLDDADIVSRMRRLELDAGLAAANEARELVLLEKGGISQERFDEVATRRQVLQAEIAVLQVDLAKTELRAPFAGRVGLRNISIGAMAVPGQLLATLQEVHRLSLDFSIPEKYAPNIKPGVVVRFRTDYLPEPLTSTVVAVEPGIDLRTRTLTVRAAVDNRDGRLIAGSSAKVEVSLQEEMPSLFVPTSALIPTISGYTVFKAVGGKAVATLVKTGTRTRDQVQILDGLSAGDTIVATNLLRVRNGVPLHIQKTY